MRYRALLLATAATIQFYGAAQTLAATSAAPPAISCEPNGTTEYICGQRRPEDLIQIPGNDWVVASSLDGGLFAVNTKDRSKATLYPTPSAKERLDSAKYSGCPGAPDEQQKAKFLTVGLALRPGNNGVHTLYAAHFGWERGVDIFELDARGLVPVVTLVGCVMAPKGVGVDALIPVENDGFVITNWLNTGPGMKAELERMKQGEVNGQLWEWYPGTGWSKLPGTETSGPNGVEVSKDGKFLYWNVWGGKSFARMSRGGGAPKMDVIPMDFRPDNIHWAPDGSLLVTGQTEEGTRIVKIDPGTLKVTPVLSLTNTPAFGSGSGAIQVGDKLWIGSATADRIAIVPVPK